MFYYFQEDPNGLTLNVILFSHKKIERNKSHRIHRIFVIERHAKFIVDETKMRL